MRAQRAVLLAVVIALLAPGCVKHEVDPPSTETPAAGMVHVRLSPMWDGVPFDKLLQYTNASGHRVLVQMIKFYLGEITLTGPTGTTMIKDIDLFDLTNGPLERYYTAVPGIYDEIGFGVGVPYDLNYTDPSLYPNEHPLSGSNGMYWTWASRYRFVIFDGRYDTVPGVGVPPYQFSIHTGFDTCYREVQLPLANSLVADDDTLDLEVEIDLERFFHNSTDTLVINQTPQWHGEVGQLEIGLRFSDLVRDAFSVP